MKGNSTAIILGIALVISSIVLGIGWNKAKSYGSFVTVKGLSERNVTADKAWMAINTSFGSNSVDDLKELLKEQENTIKNFLISSGFKSENLLVDNINIYQDNYNNSAYRYNANLRVTVSSDDVNKIEEVSRNKTDLIEKGVLITGDKWSNGPKYYFTKFSELKTEMIAEATNEAKKSAKEFADNSGAKVGKIKRANQGVFQILPSDRSTESSEFYKEKIIRVVSTFDFYLD